MTTGKPAIVSGRNGAKTYTASTQKQIREMVRRIVRQFTPEKIILLGSHARGGAGPDSDMVLLKIIPVTGSKQEKAIEIGVAMHDIRVPKDPIVVAPGELEWHKDAIGTIEWLARCEGKVLRARGEISKFRQFVEQVYT